MVESKHALKEVHRPVPEDEADSAELQLLLRQILALAGDDGATDAAPDEGRSAPGVVLDIHVEGTRYRLIRSASPASARATSLSPREREIVRLVARGLPNKAIAAILDVSLWTVATHLRRVFYKLGVSSRAEMVARALEEGLLATHG
jgi:DNA-binding CsgD family transcriptional regulator